MKKANMSSADAVVPSTGKEAGREMVTSDRNEIVVYQPNETLRLEVRLENETVWLNRNQMSQLFGRDVKTIGKHIANALKEELNPNIEQYGSVLDMTRVGEYGGMSPTVAKFATVQKEGSREVVRQVEYSWVDILTLELLAKKARGVAVEIVSSPRGNKLKPSDIATFNAQYGGLSVSTSKNFHDRFLIIDNKELYLIGASLKDLGRKCFAFTKLDSDEISGLKARI